MSIARPKYLAHIRPNDESQDYEILNDAEVDKLVIGNRCPICGDKVFKKGSILKNFTHLKCGGKCGRETIIQIL